MENSIHEDRAGRENSIVALATKKNTIVDLDHPDKPEAVIDGIFFAKLNEKTQEVEVISHDPYYKYDNHAIHYESHTKTILSPEFKEWPVINQTILINHNDMHHYEIQAQKEQQMEMEMMMGGGPPGKPGGQPGAPSPEPVAGMPAGQ